MLICPVCGREIDPDGPGVGSHPIDANDVDGEWHAYWIPFIYDLRGSPTRLVHPECYAKERDIAALVALSIERMKHVAHRTVTIVDVQMPPGSARSELVIPSPSSHPLGLSWDDRTGMGVGMQDSHKEVVRAVPVGFDPYGSWPGAQGGFDRGQPAEGIGDGVPAAKGDAGGPTPGVDRRRHDAGTMTRTRRASARAWCPARGTASRRRSSSTARGRDEAAKTLKAAISGAKLKQVSSLGSRLQVVIGSSWPGVRYVKVAPTSQPVSPGSGGSTGQINAKTATQNLCK